MTDKINTINLATAIRYGNIKDAIEILKYKNINVSYNYNELISRCIHDNNKILKLLIDHPSFNANINQKEHIRNVIIAYSMAPSNSTQKQIEILKNDKRYSENIQSIKNEILDTLIFDFDKHIIENLKFILH